MLKNFKSLTSVTSNEPALELIQKTVFDERAPEGTREGMNSIKMSFYVNSCKQTFTISRVDREFLARSVSMCAKVSI